MIATQRVLYMSEIKPFNISTDYKQMTYSDLFEMEPFDHLNM